MNNSHTLKTVILTLSLYLIISIVAFGQNTHTLEDCRELAKENYFTLQKKGLWNESEQASISMLEAAQLPQIFVMGEAKYVSDVPHPDAPVPGFPTLPKDQYQFYVSANQLIYQGGHIKQLKQVEALKSSTEIQKLEVDWYNHEQKVDALFFNAFLLEENKKSIDLAKANIGRQLEEVESRVKAGSVLPYQLDYLKAENIKLDQQLVTINAQKKAVLDALSIYTATDLSSIDQLLLTDTEAAMPLNIENIQRPELKLMDEQINLLTGQNEVYTSLRMPKLEAFGITGYGQPGYNFFNPNFDFYYQFGAKFSWNIYDWKKTKNQKKLNTLQVQMINKEKDQFLQDLETAISKQNRHIDEYQSLLSKDDEEIEIRERILQAESSRLKNGVINGSDFVKAVNESKDATVRKNMHRIQLIQAKYGLETLLGF